MSQYYTERGAVVCLREHYPDKPTPSRETIRRAVERGDLEVIEIVQAGGLAYAIEEAYLCDWAEGWIKDRSLRVTGGKNGKKVKGPRRQYPKRD